MYPQGLGILMTRSFLVDSYLLIQDKAKLKTSLSYSKARLAGKSDCRLSEKWLPTIRRRPTKLPRHTAPSVVM